MTKAKIYTYPFPGDLEFVGRPLWNKVAVKDVLRDLRDIEMRMTRKLEESANHPHERLIIAVRMRARASQRRLEKDERALQDAVADIQHLEKLIMEIKWRPKGRGLHPLTKAILAALEEFESRDSPDEKVSSHWMYNHLVSNTDVFDHAHRRDLSEHMDPPATIRLEDKSEISWKRFQQKISECRQKLRSS